jgi:cytoskeletal protein RodZ
VDVGRRLKEARLALGYTLDDVEESTKIRARYLSALEEERFNDLPGRVYGKAFLRTYARFLRLDAEELDREFDQIFPPEKGEPVEIKHSPVARRPRYANYVVVLCIIAGLLIFNAAYRALQMPRENTPPPEDTSSGLVDTPKQKPSGAVQKPQGVNLKLAVTGDACWAQVRVDDEPAFEGMLTSGDRQEFQGRRKVWIKLGNAGAVHIEFNGKEIGYLGKTGDVVTHEFAAQGDQG